MEDLTEEIEDADTAEEEAKIYDIWLGGDEFSDDPVAELNARLDEAVDDDQVNTYNVVTDAEEAEKAVFAAEDTDTDPTEISPDKRVRLSPQGLEDAISNLDDTLSANNIRINDGEIVATPAGIARYKETFTGYPDLNVDRDEKNVGLRVDDSVLELTAPLPDDPQEVADALDLLEQYIETVGEFGETRTPKETRAHFYEGIIYFCWAPFADYCAHHYAEYESAELDKDLPFLFLHGDNDSGKGMFLRFGTRLISNGYVQEVTTGDDFVKTTSSELVRRTPFSRTSLTTWRSRKSTATSSSRTGREVGWVYPDADVHFLLERFHEAEIRTPNSHEDAGFQR